MKTARTPLFNDVLPTTVRASHLKLRPSQSGLFFLPHSLSDMLIASYNKDRASLHMGPFGVRKFT